MTELLAKDANYERCFFAFIDILGFKNLVQGSERDNEKLKLLRDSLRLWGSLPNGGVKTVDDGNSVRRVEFRTQQFSDSIVIYCKENSADLAQLFHVIRFLQDQMWLSGICLRGAITIGDMYWPPHNENIILGPAMIEAYELESKCAIYPRILISKGLRQYINQQQPIVGNYLDSSNNLNDAICAKDELPFLDILSSIVTRKSSEVLGSIGSNFSIMWDPEEESSHAEICGAVAAIIRDQLQQTTKPEICQKYIWLQNQLNRVQQDG